MTQRGRKKETYEEIRASVANLTPTEIAYAAGFFDGEGCVAIYEHKAAPGWFQVRFQVQISNVDTRPLLWLQQKFGGKITRRGGVRAKNAIHRECYYWYAMNKRAEIFFELVRPYVLVKGDQIDLAVAFRETYLDRWRDPVNGRVRKVPDDVREQRRNLAAQLKALKRRTFEALN